MSEIEEFEVKNYKCPICGYIYDSLKEAQACKEWGEKLKDFEKNSQAHVWYRFDHKDFWGENTNRSTWHFARKVSYKSRFCGPAHRCLDNELVLSEVDGRHGFLLDYDISSKDGTICPEFETVKEHYEKTGEIPGPYDKKTLAKLPKEVIQDINECLEDARQKAKKEALELSKEELVEKYLTETNTYFKDYIRYWGPADGGYKEEEEEEERNDAFLRCMCDISGSARKDLNEE